MAQALQFNNGHNCATCGPQVVYYNTTQLINGKIAECDNSYNEITQISKQQLEQIKQDFQEVNQMREEINFLRQQLFDKDMQLIHKDTEINMKNVFLQDKDAIIADKNNKIIEKTTENNQLNTELNNNMKNLQNDNVLTVAKKGAWDVMYSAAFKMSNVFGLVQKEDKK